MTTYARLMVTLALAIAIIFILGILYARAQSPTLQEVYGPGRGPYAPTPHVYSAWGYAPLPPAVIPPPPPPVEAPQPYPIGWVYRYYAPCADPECRSLIVNVGADGLNFRAVPKGPVLGALVNGTPLAPLTKQGDWVLVAPLCNLAPTWTWSWTAGVPLSVCM